MNLKILLAELSTLRKLIIMYHYTQNMQRINNAEKLLTGSLRSKPSHQAKVILIVFET